MGDDNRIRPIPSASPTVSMYRPLIDDEVTPKGCNPGSTWEHATAWKQGDRRGWGGQASFFQGASRTRCDPRAIGGGDLLDL